MHNIACDMSASGIVKDADLARVVFARLFVSVCDLCYRFADTAADICVKQKSAESRGCYIADFVGCGCALYRSADCAYHLRRYKIGISVTFSIKTNSRQPVFGLSAVSVLCSLSVGTTT